MRVVGLGIGWDELKAGDKLKTINRTITCLLYTSDAADE